MRKFLIWLFVVVALLVAVAFGLRWWFISDLRKPILSEMTDPDSALFRNESFVGNWLGDGIYCGEVNEKNMFGYVGYRRFYVRSAVKDTIQGFHSIAHPTSMDTVSSLVVGMCDDVRYINKPWWYIRW